MKILFVSPQYPANPIRFLSDTLVDMGHELYKIGALYNNHGGLATWGKHNASVDVQLERAQPAWDLTEYLELCTAAIGAPDICICSEETYSTKIRRPIGKKIPTVLLSWDGWPHVWDRCNDFQSVLNYTGHPFGIRIHPREEPDPRWKFFGPACYPKVHQFLNIPRDIDFVLNAAMYGARQEICDFMRSRRLSVRSGYVLTDEYVMNANRGFATYINSNKQRECKWRAMEGAAMGLLNICDDHLLYEWIGAKPYEHYFPISLKWNERIQEWWPDGQMVYECIQVLKENPNLAEHIRKNAMELAMKYHTYEARVNMILEDLRSL